MKNTHKINLFNFLIIFLCIILISGCTKVKVDNNKNFIYLPSTKPYKIFNKWYYPLESSKDYYERGIASWYGDDFHGKKTSNGEVYNMYAMTAAHKTLPLGTHVRVSNLNNGKSIRVRINDRGPFIDGRIIDLSYKAAQKIGLVAEGTASVSVTAINSSIIEKNSLSHFSPADFSKECLTIQVGAFKNNDNAEILKQKLNKFYKDINIEIDKSKMQPIYRVKVGRCLALPQASHYEKMLIKHGYADAFITK
ncbi:rare lipoprotein A [Candidatus Magnetomoraceae bacterium gMMP-1]